MFKHLLDASLFSCQIVANVYMWNPYLHTCNPNLLTSGFSLPTAIAAATAAATFAAAAAAAPTAAAAATILLPGASSFWKTGRTCTECEVSWNGLSM